MRVAASLFLLLLTAAMNEQTASSETALRERLARFSSYLASDRANLRLLADTADLHYQLGEFESARALLLEALALSPDDNGITFQLATLDIAQSQPALAMTKLQWLQARGIDNGAVSYNLAYAQALQKQFAEAKDTLQAHWEQVVAEVPQADLLLGRLYHHLGDVDAALECFQRYGDLDQNAEANGLVSLALVDKESYEAARPYAVKALNMQKGQHEALLALGMMNLAGGETDLSLAHFHQATSVRSDSGRAWIGIGLAEMANLDLAQAEQSLERGLRHMPEHLGSWVSLAWCQIAQQKLAEAASTLQRAMAIDRNFGEVHGTLAVVFAMQGDLAAASREAELGSRLSKGQSFAAAFAQSLLLAARGQTVDAQASVQSILQRPINHDGKTLEKAVQEMAMKNPRFQPKNDSVPPADGDNA